LTYPETKMQSILFVFLGGGLGSVTRFLLGRWITSLHAQDFPWGTLAVNVTACLALGLLVGIADQKQIISPPMRLFWTVGFCGGFSTFSTFSMESLQLMQSGLTTSLLLYVSFSLLLCVAATFAGIYAGENVF
jgi:CrcB protein